MGGDGVSDISAGAGEGSWWDGEWGRSYIGSIARSGASRGGRTTMLLMKIVLILKKKLTSQNLFPLEISVFLHYTVADSSHESGGWCPP